MLNSYGSYGNIKQMQRGRIWMIRNIVFDMGWVLFSYEPKKYIRKYCHNEDDAELLNREIFEAPEWAETDRGTMTDEDYLALVLRRIPERLHKTARFLYGHWHEMPKPFPEIEELARTLKNNGYRLYLLTNMSTRFYRFYRNIPAVTYFDGMTVSADVHLLKPDPEIYLTLFRKFCLKPEECFFIDDIPENIAAGEKLGMKGFCYAQNPEKLAEALESAGVKL